MQLLSHNFIYVYLLIHIRKDNLYSIIKHLVYLLVYLSYIKSFTLCKFINSDTKKINVSRVNLTKFNYETITL